MTNDIMSNTLNGLLDGIGEPVRGEILTYMRAAGRQILRDSIGHVSLCDDLVECNLDRADVQLRREALELAQENIDSARKYLESPPASDMCRLHWTEMIHVFNEKAEGYRARGLIAEPISHPLLFYYPRGRDCPCDSGKKYRECCFDKFFI